MKRYLLVFFAAAIFCFAMFGCGNSSNSGAGGGVTGSNENNQAPDFSLKNVNNGQQISLSGFKGKVVLLDFWATWCPPCREEIPHLVKLYEQDKSKGLVILGVSLDDTPTPVGPFMEEFHMDYPVVMADDAVQRAYGGIDGIPTTFLIDKNGKIAKKFVGYTDVSVFETQIDKLL